MFPYEVTLSGTQRTPVRLAERIVAVYETKHDPDALFRIAVSPDKWVLQYSYTHPCLVMNQHGQAVWEEAFLGSRLGKRISFKELPMQYQLLAVQTINRPYMKELA